MRESILEGGGLRLVFFQVGDRLAHRVESIRGDQPECLLESIEGTPAEAWPASPPLQNLHIEQRAVGRQVALLVGMAGRSHWSLSVELDPDRRQLTFDAACRLRQVPDFLGTTYFTGLPVTLGRKTGVVVLGSTGVNAELVLEMWGDPVASASIWQYNQGQRHLRLAVPSTNTNAATTVRWQYTIRLGQGG